MRVRRGPCDRDRGTGIVLDQDRHPRHLTDKRDDDPLMRRGPETYRWTKNSKSRVKSIGETPLRVGLGGRSVVVMRH